MKLPLGALALIVLYAAATHSQTPSIQLEERSFLDSKLFIQMPKEFEVMGEQMLKLKYPSERRPTLVYTNERGTVNVALNHTQDRVTLSQLPDLHKTVETTFRNAYPSATWFRNELTEINGRRCFLLDLRTPAIDTRVRNLILGTSLQGRFLIISINATQELESAWLPIANKIIQSVRIQE
jgi:hypothetical protein